MTASDSTMPGQPCPHAGCRNFNPPRARYCARCGRPLSGDRRPSPGPVTLLTLVMIGIALLALLGWLGVAVWSGLGLIFFGFAWRRDDRAAT